ncbi:DNA double-strand break repair nuclease NurA [Finegoldia magna]|uniref:DNA double-strand break repair nuclease NurA n=1 Tax=Finegoldia magna TaxID=1260 RepID=UPI000B915E6F|nr:DNA double-strand break repair nuclease NurA [Finegoldia magna]MDU2132144.1 DNA double-strand break repair nuclease NurA [Finegoldia magna]MDU2219919.1 DNA double-strand break repair nuclease NurA [Finegoldia magna]MDU6551721.1 DNA double-strand break repair nuclease NurA [Finegoldia magna]OXZ34450.1 nuclease [Finegoldia magna]
MISKDLIDEVSHLNERLKNRKNVSKLSRKDVRDLINNKIGKIKFYERFSVDKLKEIKQDGCICVVDGSVNRIGANYPNYVEFFQSMALLSSDQEPLVKADILCPLVDEFSERDQFQISKEKLCATELAVAIEAVKNHDIKILMMDGTLMRYCLEAEDLYNDLVELCDEKGVILVGVVEEINTKIIMNTFNENGVNVGMLFDREALFNVLDMNEGFVVNEHKSRKKEYDIEQAFIRTSKDPCVIAIDIPSQNMDDFDEIISFVLTLSDENTRGVPFLLDLVDKKTRIDNKQAEILAKKYLDTEMYQSIFRSQRSKRVI